jgi:hypothetical protein
MRKEMVMPDFKVVSQNLPVGPEKNHNTCRRITLEDYTWLFAYKHQNPEDLDLEKTRVYIFFFCRRYPSNCLGSRAGYIIYVS